MPEEKEPLYIGEYEPEDEIAKINRFYIPLEGARFYKVSPITDEERKEAEAMWEAMTGGKYIQAERRKYTEMAYSQAHG